MLSELGEKKKQVVSSIKVFRLKNIKIFSISLKCSILGYHSTISKWPYANMSQDSVLEKLGAD